MPATPSKLPRFPRPRKAPDERPTQRSALAHPSRGSGGRHALSATFRGVPSDTDAHRGVGYYAPRHRDPAPSSQPSSADLVANRGAADDVSPPPKAGRERADDDRTTHPSESQSSAHAHRPAWNGSTALQGPQANAEARRPAYRSTEGHGPRAAPHAESGPAVQGVTQIERLPFSSLADVVVRRPGRLTLGDDVLPSDSDDGVSPSSFKAAARGAVSFPTSVPFHDTQRSDIDSPRGVDVASAFDPLGTTLSGTRTGSKQSPENPWARLEAREAAQREATKFRPGVMTPPHPDGQRYEHNKRHAAAHSKSSAQPTLGQGRSSRERATTVEGTAATHEEEETSQGPDKLGALLASADMLVPADDGGWDLPHTADENVVEAAATRFAPHSEYAHYRLHSIVTALGDDELRRRFHMLGGHTPDDAATRHAIELASAPRHDDVAALSHHQHGIRSADPTPSVPPHGTSQSQLSSPLQGALARSVDLSDARLNAARALLSEAHMRRQALPLPPSLAGAVDFADVATASGGGDLSQFFRGGPLTPGGGASRPDHHASAVEISARTALTSAMASIQPPGESEEAEGPAPRRATSATRPNDVMGRTQRRGSPGAGARPRHVSFREHGRHAPSQSTPSGRSVESTAQADTAATSDGIDAAAVARRIARRISDAERRKDPNPQRPGQPQGFIGIEGRGADQGLNPSTPPRASGAPSKIGLPLSPVSLPAGIGAWSPEVDRVRGLAAEYHATRARHTEDRAMFDVLGAARE